MDLTWSYLVILLLYAAILNQIRLPLVSCQDEEVTQCIPKKAFLALLRLPEVSSNLAAYSRTARIIRNTENRNDMVHLRILTEESEDTEMCIPSAVYSELFKNPAIRGHLSAIRRTQKLPNLPGRFVRTGDEVYPMPTFQKRSIATLAKNDDLPITVHEHFDGNQDDGEKRTGASSPQWSGPGDYLLPRDDLNKEVSSESYPVEKRNVGSLARDFALPPGRRNVVSLVRNSKFQTKGNTRDQILPFAGKRNIVSIDKILLLPEDDERSIGFADRDYQLSYGKRYVGSLARKGDFPLPKESKRNVASLSRNLNWPASLKRGISNSGAVIVRTPSRQGRSLSDELSERNDLLDLRKLANLEDAQDKSQETEMFEEKRSGDFQRKSAAIGKIDIDNFNKLLPMIQRTDFDYENMMEVLTSQYPNAEKRFMGRIPQMGPRPTTPSTRRQGR